MANRDAPMGFSPWGRTLSGGELTLGAYKKAAGYGTAIYPGDLLTRINDGTLERSITPGTTSMIGVAMDGGALSVATEHNVADQPDMIFVGQADGSLAEADMGLKSNAIIGTGSLALNQSRDEINSAAEATTATLDLHLLRKADKVGNAFGAYVRLEVLINKHLLNKGVAGV